MILNGQETVELGFRLFKHERQKGYLKEVATSLREDIQTRAFKSVLAFSAFNNIPVYHLLIKLGFIQRSSAHFLNMDVIFFERILQEK